MPRFQKLGKDDTVHLKGGEKFIVIKKDDVMPDGRLQPMAADQTEEEYYSYVEKAIYRIVRDTSISDTQVTQKLTRLCVAPDDMPPNVLGEMRKIVMDLTKPNSEIWKARTHQKRKERLDVLLAWEEEHADKFKLELNDCSRAHKLTEAAAEKRLMGAFLQTEKDDPTLFTRNEINPLELSLEHIFVVRHDWLMVLGDTNPELHEWEIPFPQCTFEFRVSGKNVIVALDQASETLRNYTLYVESEKDFWIVFDATELTSKIGAYILKQVAACCVVIEAEVVSTDLVKQPAALNAKRAKIGKPPMNDYHVIDLTRRHHTNAAKSEEPSSGIRMRAHFVRGHWRHFKDGKPRIRIPWHLRGDINLGYVDKHYKL